MPPQGRRGRGDAERREDLVLSARCRLEGGDPPAPGERGRPRMKRLARGARGDVGREEVFGDGGFFAVEESGNGLARRTTRDNDPRAKHRAWLDRASSERTYVHAKALPPTANHEPASRGPRACVVRAPCR